MTQTQMTAYLADKIGITKRQAKSALDELNARHDPQSNAGDFIRPACR